FSRDDSRPLTDDTLATKGFKAVKVDNGDNTYTTVITTHLIAGGGKWLPKLFGNDLESEIRRDQAYGEIRNYVTLEGEKSPKAHPQMQCAGVVITGDTNQWCDNLTMLGGTHEKTLICENL